jgi:hypothetical protein
MEALAQGRHLRRTSDGWRDGLLVAPASLVDDLRRRDLVREEAGRLVPTAAGRGYGARNAAPEGANRLLAERALPRDGEPRDRTTAARRTRSVTVNLAEAPLGWLKARGMVSERQYEAGERLRADWTTAGLSPRVTMRWDATPIARGARGPGAPLDATLAQIAAKRRFEAAIAAAGGGLSAIAWRVICAGEGLEPAEKALGWPRRSGKLVLLMALDRIADFYAIR